MSEGIGEVINTTSQEATTQEPEGQVQNSQQTVEVQGAQVAQGDNQGQQANSNPLDNIANMFKSGGMNTGAGEKLSDKIFTDFDFGDMTEKFNSMIDSDSGQNFTEFLKTKAYSLGINNNEDFKHFVAGAQMLAEDLKLFEDEKSLEERVETTLMSIPKELHNNLEAIWNRASGVLNKDEMQIFCEKFATDKDTLILLDKLIGNQLKYNKGAFFEGKSKETAYTLEQFRKDLRDDRYYTDENFRKSVDEKGKIFD